MPDALGVCGTMCKVEKEENLLWGYSQLPSQNARIKVRLLYPDNFHTQTNYTLASVYPNNLYTG